MGQQLHQALYGTGRPGYDMLRSPHHPNRLPRCALILDTVDLGNVTTAIERLSIYGTSCAAMKPNNEFVHALSVS